MNMNQKIRDLTGKIARVRGDVDKFREKVRKQLSEKLLKEMVSIPSGWEEEVYCSDEGEISFSSPLTPNTHTRSPDIIGSISALTAEDVVDLDGTGEIYAYDDDTIAYRTEEAYENSPDYGDGIWDEDEEAYLVPVEKVVKNWDLDKDDWYIEMVDEMTENAVSLYYGEE